MERFRLEWCTGDSSEVIRPLVVLFPWVWAGSSYIQKYVCLCQDQGWDVLLVKWPMAAMWFPMWSRYMADSVVEALANYLQQRGERPVVLYAFSGSAKGVLSSVLSLLARQHPLSEHQASAVATVLRCCAGCIYDSCPVDFTSEAGKRLIAPRMFTASGGVNSSSSSSSSQASYSSSSSRLFGAAARLARSAATFAAGLSCDVAAGGMDFFLLEWFEKDRAAMWTALHNTPVHGPLLFMYSRSDKLVDAAQLADLAASLRLKGHEVVEQSWQDTPHCGHYRSHPEQYTESVSFLLSKAIQEWAARSSRVREGREWAASWQRDLAGQQQQQDLAGQQQRQYAGHTVWAGQWSSRPLGHQQSQPQYHAADADVNGETQQQQGDEAHEQQQPQLTMQHTRGIMFGISRRQQQQHIDRAAGGQYSPGSSSSNMRKCNSSSTGGGCIDSSCSHGPTTTGLCKAVSCDSTSTQTDQQMRQPARAAATGCCCSGSVLAAVTAAAVAEAANPGMNRALTAGHVRSTSSSSSSGGGFLRTHQGAAAATKQQLCPHMQQQQQQQRRSTSRDLTSLVLLSHAAARPDTHGRSNTTCNALISTCCACEASECRCAETLAAASGEVVCSDSTTLSHSLRCMTSTYMGRQQQKQQEQQLRQQQQLRYHSGSSSSHSSSSTISLVSSPSMNIVADGAPIVSSNKAAPAAVTTDVWQQQQQVHAMHLLQQQQHEQPFVQRVVFRLRSKL